MPRIDLIKNSYGTLEPSLDKDKEVVDKWPVGEILACDVRKERNIKFHRKFFALMQFCCENQDRYDNLDDFLDEIKLRTGHYKTHVTVKGIKVYIPKSISFAKMDELEFSTFYQKAIDVCLKHFVVGMSQKELDNCVNIILGFS